MSDVFKDFMMLTTTAPLGILLRTLLRASTVVQRLSVSLICLSVMSFLVFSGCVDPAPKLDLTVEHVQPSPIIPGAQIKIIGHRFGETVGEVSIRARPLEVIDWRDQLITARIPEDTPGGEAYLVLTSEGRPSAPFAVIVDNDLESRGGRPPEATDASLPTDDVAVVEDRDAEPPIDLGPSDPSSLTVALNVPDAEVTFSARRVSGDRGEELWVTFESSLSAWGAAAHLIYPEDRLIFLGTEGEQTRYMQAKESALEDRIFWYSARLSSGSLITLRFQVIDPTLPLEIPLTLPPRFAALRSGDNVSLSARWSSGVIRDQRSIREAP
jgi:hypothetical protein